VVRATAGPSSIIHALLDETAFAQITGKAARIKAGMRWNWRGEAAQRFGYGASPQCARGIQERSPEKTYTTIAAKSRKKPAQKNGE
jgi:hypothetical protein